MNISNILNGWQNFLSKSEVTEERAKGRANRCSDCEHAKHGKLIAFIKDELTEVQGSYCNLCKCPLSAKIRSEKESCPIQEW